MGWLLALGVLGPGAAALVVPRRWLGLLSFASVSVAFALVALGCVAMARRDTNGFEGIIVVLAALMLISLALGLAQRRHNDHAAERAMRTGARGGREAPPT